jgi:hypothetical protein
LKVLPPGQVQREPVRKPQNRESRSHSQPFSRGRKVNQTHFTVNPRKRNGTGRHRSDFSHSLAGCWPARTVQNGSTSEAGGDGFRDVRGTYGVQGVPGKSLGVHARGRQTPLGFWRVVTQHPADAGACGCGAKVRVGSGGEATKSTCRVSSLVVTNALHTQHMRCWSPSWIIHQLQSVFRPTIVAMLPC